MTGLVRTRPRHCPPERDTALPALAHRPVAVVAGLFVAGLLLLSNRYGLHRDELYFLAASHRPAWGYLDQPPLTPMLTRVAIAVFGETPFGIDFTLAERDSEEGPEGVKTGLRRELNDGMVEVDEDEEEQEQEAGAGKVETKQEAQEAPERKPMPLEQVLRFMNTGQMPVGG